MTAMLDQASSGVNCGFRNRCSRGDVLPMVIWRTSPQLKVCGSSHNLCKAFAARQRNSRIIQAMLNARLEV